MNAITQTRNAFDALCLLAARERWCWQIYCRTCGHLFFRYGLQELARGRHPDSEQWLVSKSHPVLLRGGNPRDLGSVPERWIPWSVELQERLAGVLADADLSAIRATCSHPAWLGYLGLGLKYTEEAEQATRLISNSWIPQLLTMMPVNAYSRSKLLSMLQDTTLPLTWPSLAGLKLDLKPMSREDEDGGHQ